MKNSKIFRKKKAFAWLLANILSGLGIMLVIQSVVLSIGLQQALRRYSDNQLQEKEDIARNILINPEDFQAENLQYSSPFFVFRADKSLVFSNRGKGRAIPEQALRRIEYNGNLIGYYYTDQIRFSDNRSNQIFLTTLIMLILSSVFLSLAIAVTLSILTARRITRPLSEISDGIRKLHLLKPIDLPQNRILELSDISEEVNSISIFHELL